MGTYSYSGTPQFITVSQAGDYDIAAYGAQGGAFGGLAGGDGAETEGLVHLTAGEHLEIIVGQAGKAPAPGPLGGFEGSGGGGGGSFVFGYGTGDGTGNGRYTLLLAAGGGGGAGVNGDGATGSGYGVAAGSGTGSGGAAGSGNYGNGGGGAGVNSAGGTSSGAVSGNGAGSITGFGNGAAGGGNGGFGGGGGGSGFVAFGRQPGGGGGGGGGYTGGHGGNGNGTITGGYGGRSFAKPGVVALNSEHSAGGVNTGNGEVVITPNVVCFTSGTRICTARGDVAVEALAVGDRVVTASGALRSITWIGHHDVDCAALDVPHEAWPVRILTGAFGGDLPQRDLRLSPGHPVLVDEHLVPIMCLINGTSIARVAVETVTYWHVELDEHDILLAEGLPAESFLDFGNRPWFGPDAEAHALANPDFVVPGLGARCRPVAIDGPVVECERRRLDALFAMRLTTQCAWSADEAWVVA